MPERSAPQPLASDLSQVALPQSWPRVYKAMRKGDDPPIVEDGTALSRQLHWLAVAFPVALVTGLVTFIDYDRQLWIDEYVTVYVTNLSTHDFVHLLHNQNLVHALYYVFTGAWTGIFGTSLLALRSPSMVGMAVAAGGIAVLGRRLCNLTVGIAAGLIFAALPAVFPLRRRGALVRLRRGARCAVDPRPDVRRRPTRKAAMARLH